MKKKLLVFFLVVAAVLSMVGCGKKEKGPELTGNAKVVADASKMTVDELAANAKEGSGD